VQRTQFSFYSTPGDSLQGAELKESQAIQWAQDAWSAEAAVENTTVSLRLSTMGSKWFWTATVIVSYAPQAPQAPPLHAQPTRESEVKHEHEGIYLPVKAPVNNIKKEPVPVD